MAYDWIDGGFVIFFFLGVDKYLNCTKKRKEEEDKVLTVGQLTALTKGPRSKKTSFGQIFAIPKSHL